MAHVVRLYSRPGCGLCDEAREVILPQGIDVRVVRGHEEGDGRDSQPPRPPREIASTKPSGDGAAEREAVSTPAEAGLASETSTIEEQARHAWSPEQDENLLAPSKR